MNKDTFQTIGYKGEFIQTCYNRDTQREEARWNGKEFKSAYAAKLAITKQQNAVNEHLSHMNAMTHVPMVATRSRSPMIPRANPSPYRKGGKSHRRMF